MPYLNPITSASGIMAHTIDKNQNRFGKHFFEVIIPEQIPTNEWVKTEGKSIPFNYFIMEINWLSPSEVKSPQNPKVPRTIDARSVIAKSLVIVFGVAIILISP